MEKRTSEQTKQNRTRKPNPGTERDTTDTKEAREEARGRGEGGPVFPLRRAAHLFRRVAPAETK